MVFLGVMSFYIALVGCALCWAFDVTLLVLTGKEQRLAAQAPVHDMTSQWPTSYPPLTMGLPPTKPLPSILRKPTIFAAFCIASIWMASFVALIHSLIRFDEFIDPVKMVTRAWIASPAVETVFTALQIVVLETIGVLSWRERKAMIAGGSQLKWYQLGEYRL